MLHMYLKTKPVQTEKQGKKVETLPHDCCRNKDFRNRLLYIFDPSFSILSLHSPFSCPDVILCSSKAPSLSLSVACV